MITIIIGFICFVLGACSGCVLMSFMVAASRENDLREELDKMYCHFNDHMLAISPDETTPDSEYEFRKGMSVGIQQCLNSLGEILK